MRPINIQSSSAYVFLNLENASNSPPRGRVRVCGLYNIRSMSPAACFCKRRYLFCRRLSCHFPYWSCLRFNVSFLHLAHHEFTTRSTGSTMHSSRRHALLVLAFALAPSAHAACECGYETNAKQVFQYALVTSFANTSLSTTTLASFENSPDWNITSIVYGASTSRPYATNYTRSNVNVANNALQLTCSAYDDASGSVPSAQIQTQRSDILHGSFRAQYKIQSNASAGAVSGFFFYANDTAEIDVELLTRLSPQDIVLTNQPDASATVYMPDGLTYTEVNDYRIDWSAQSTQFYVNNVLSNNKTADVPAVNGSVYLNMWGGSTYAGNPPPTSDVTMSVSAVQLYFNTSDAKLSASWAKTCASSKAAVCQVDAHALRQNTTDCAKSEAAKPRGRHHARWVAAAGAVLMNFDA